MHLCVRLMRRRGVRLEWRDIENGPVVAGDLRSHIHPSRSEPVIVLCVFDTGAPVQGHQLELYQPTLVGMSTNAMTLRGIERGGFVQEWYVTTP